MIFRLPVVRRFLAVAVVLGASLISVAPDALAQCRNGWCTGGCKEDFCSWIKLKNRGYPVRRVISRDSARKEFVMDYDCQRYLRRFVNSDGTVSRWDELMPGTVGERSLEVACSM